MKIKIALVIFTLLSANVFAQRKPIGQFEYKDFFTSGIEKKIITINFLQNSSFKLKRFNEEICYRTTENINGIFKIKKDTIILITPLSKKYFTTSDSINLAPNKFIYFINTFKHKEYADLKKYLMYLDFYFLDKDFNLNTIKPAEVKSVIDTSYKGQEQYSELYFKFIIPPNVTHFIAREKYSSSTTFNIDDIKGKQFTDIIRSKEDRFDDRLKECIDITFERYILNKKMTSFTLVDDCPAIPSYNRIVTFKRK